MKYLLSLFLVVVLIFPYSTWAVTQTHSLDLEAGSSQYASISDASQTGLDITGDLTIEAWVKVESAPGTNIVAIVASKWGATDVDDSYEVGYWNNGGTLGLSFFVGDGAGDNDFHHFTTTLTTGTWYHVAWAYDASTATVEYFIDGSSVGTDTGSVTAIANGGAPFAIGVEDPAVTPSRYFDGLVDDVRAWSDIRTGTELTDNAENCNLSASEAGLVGWWHLNEVYTDETANNNDLTAVNSPVFSTDVPYTCAAASTPLFHPHSLF